MLVRPLSLARALTLARSLARSLLSRFLSLSLSLSLFLSLSLAHSFSLSLSFSLSFSRSLAHTHAHTVGCGGRQHRDADVSIAKRDCRSRKTPRVLTAAEKKAIDQEDELNVTKSFFICPGRRVMDPRPERFSPGSFFGMPFKDPVNHRAMRSRFGLSAGDAGGGILGGDSGSGSEGWGDVWYPNVPQFMWTDKEGTVLNVTCTCLREGFGIPRQGCALSEAWDCWVCPNKNYSRLIIENMVRLCTHVHTHTHTSTHACAHAHLQSHTGCGPLHPTCVARGNLF